MANYFITSTTVAAGVIYDLNVYDTIFVAAQGLLASTDSTAIIADGTSNQVTVAGTLYGLTRAIHLGARNEPATYDGNCSLVILPGGTVASNGDGGAAVGLSGVGQSVSNAGVIMGTYGIWSGFGDSNPASDAVIQNSGEIIAREAGLVLVSFSGSITNSGLISCSESKSYGAFASPLGNLLGGAAILGNGVLFNNSGTISSASSEGYGVAISGTGTRVVNSGLIETNSIDANRAAVDLVTADGQVASFTNTSTGHITSLATAVQGGDGIETIVNRGELVGDVLLGGGGDVFEGRSGVVMGAIQGGDGDDWVRGGGLANDIDGGRGSDNLAGNGGEDTIRGGRGRDILRGGGDADVFIYANVLESRAGAVNRDIIRDFVHKLDTIDLSSVDADETIGGNQDFTFIGASVFSAPGQVRYDSTTGVVSMNTDGDLAAEMQISLAGKPVITGVDFIL